MNSEQKRLLLAIVLSGVILFGWQMYFAPKNDFIPVSTDQEQIKSEDNKIVHREDVEVKKEKVDIRHMESDNLLVEKLIIGKGDNKFFIDTSLSINNISSNANNFSKVVGEKKTPFSVQVLVDGKFEKINFSIIEKTSDKIKGQNSKYSINLLLQELDDQLKLTITSITPYRYRFIFDSEEKAEGARRERNFSLFLRSDVERITIGDDETGDGTGKWFGIDFDYYLFAFVLNDKTSIKYHTKKNGTMIVDVIDEKNAIDGKIVFLKKDYTALAKQNDKLEFSVDFGMFQLVAVPLLKSIQFFYKYFPNYGVAIIIVTLLVRLILFPLNYKSFKSMKKMQVIQPEINKIKEKFKNDPQRMQKETMAAFKKAGANPLGGCLPILLQMPVFFAFYKVLFNSVDMVGAPFYFWISDLSVKDPFYVLPIAMTAVMLIQQIFMPSTQTDPMQKKLMYGMPIFFGFIMKDMPAGLCLYFLISNLCGVTQQFFVNKSVK